jgi:RNA polymerase sigma factor (TIGR02999 family)
MADLWTDLAAPGADPRSLSEAFAVLYDELRRIAHRQLGRVRPGQTLSTTALVHEAFLKLARVDVTPADRTHFFALAARAMRQILVDAAREQSAAKRGGGQRPVSLDDDAIRVEAIADDVLAIDGALGRLERLDPDLARVVEYRFFAGLTDAEIAALLNSSARTVRRSWRKARAFLYREISAPGA